MPVQQVNFTLNGKPVTVTADDEQNLLTWLRETMGLTGTKCGCNAGHCGSCTVLVNGKARKACLVKLKNLGGSQILTIEGLAAGGQLHPIQQSFIECGAVQCGFCTPSMIMASLALLGENLNPTVSDIKKALARVYCRCGTYPRVIQAVQRAAAIMRGEKPRALTLDGEAVSGSIGQSLPMRDIMEKVTGKLRFADDYNFESQLYGKIVWSEYPHARIVDIDTQEAQNFEGVELVLTYKDLPLNLFGVLEKDQPILAEGRVRYIGEPVAVVFAGTAAQAEAATKRVKVAYEELEGVFSVRRALEEDAPQLHEKGNVIQEMELNKGSIEEAFRSADVVVEGEYYTPFIEHAWIEPESILAAPNSRGGVDIYAQTQSPFRIRDHLVSILNMEEHRINVIQVPCGGSFGGKGDFSLQMSSLVALAAIKTGRPAKISLTREESLRFHPKRHAYFMHYKLAADRKGKILGMDIDLVADGGAYASYTPRVILQSVAYSTGPYYVPNLRVSARAVYTNNLVSGAMRGYGAPQVHFAAECQMDILARKLGLDPLELRRKNALAQNLEAATGQILGPGHAFTKTLDVIKEEVVTKLLPLKKDNNVGIGVASGWRHIGGGLGPEETAGASLVLQENGRFLLKTACSQLGQETQTGLLQIAAHVLGIPYTSIDAATIETLKVPYGGAVMSSRGIYLWGLAVEKACRKMEQALRREVSRLTGIGEQDIHFYNGLFIHGKTRAGLLKLSELAKALGVLEVEEYVRLPKTYPIMGDGNRSKSLPLEEYKTHHTNSYNTTAVAVRVNKEKEIEVLKVIVAVDAGRVINPEAAKRQIEGGVIMGIGAALSEEFVIERGRNLTDSFRKCNIPSIKDIPEIDVIFVENEDPSGPLGAKGVGEIGILAVAPAIVNAIYDATGHRVFRLPVRL